MERSYEARPAVVDWREVLRGGLSQVSGSVGRDRPNWNRPSRRRSFEEDVILPSWQGSQPRIAVIVDVSGSMGIKAVQQIVNEVQRLAALSPNGRFWLGVHTDEPCFTGFIDGRDQVAVTSAVSFSGGTDPRGTYKALCAAGRFEKVIHFTDRYFGLKQWPALPPGARLVVGDFSGGEPSGTHPPGGSVVVPCMPPGES
jgi:predicted metal-dependent peptidase